MQERPSLKRKSTATIERKRPEIRNILTFNNGPNDSLLTPGPGNRPRQYSFSAGPHSAPLIPTSHGLPPQLEHIPIHAGQHSMSQVRDSIDDAAADAAAAAAAANRTGSAGKKDEKTKKEKSSDKDKTSAEQGDAVTVVVGTGRQQQQQHRRRGESQARRRWK